MKRSARRLRILFFVVTIGVLAIAASVWVDVVERWISQELHSLAAHHLKPTLAFDDLTYTFPRTITVHRVRLTSADLESPGQSVDILAAKSLTLVLNQIPRPNRLFEARQLDLDRPVLRLVRKRGGQNAGELLGFSDFVKHPSKGVPGDARPAFALSRVFQVRLVSIHAGSAEYDARDGRDAALLIDGIEAALRLQPSDAGIYAVDFSLDHHPALTLALRGKLLADEKRLEVAALSATLQLARAQDHYLAGALQRLVTERDITGHLTLTASGMFDLDDRAASIGKAKIDLREAHYAAGDYKLSLDRVDARLSSKGTTIRIEEFAIDALGGHATVTGSIESGENPTCDLKLQAADLQIGELLSGSSDPHGVPSFAGLLGFTGTLRGSLADIERDAAGAGRLTLRKARLARLPVLATIDEALDRTAEAFMKREHTGHDALSLDFTFEGDHAAIGKLRMNSRWYGLRGHGEVYFDSRLDLAVDGGPVQRIENEIGAVGDVLGEITETLLRARVTGTVAKPEVGIEILRHSPHL